MTLLRGSNLWSNILSFHLFNLKQYLVSKHNLNAHILNLLWHTFYFSVSSINWISPLVYAFLGQHSYIFFKYMYISYSFYHCLSLRYWFRHSPWKIFHHQGHIIIIEPKGYHSFVVHVVHTLIKPWYNCQTRIAHVRYLRWKAKSYNDNCCVWFNYTRLTSRSYNIKRTQFL